MAMKKQYRICVYARYKAEERFSPTAYAADTLEEAEAQMEKLLKNYTNEKVSTEFFIIPQYTKA